MSLLAGMGVTLAGLAWGENSKPVIAAPKGPALVELVRPGSMVIVGGGGTPKEALDWFHQKAGQGVNHLVIIPSASASPDKQPPATWTKSHEGQVGKITVLHASSREQADKPEFAQPLREASAVWISGGDQNRLADLYRETPVHQEIQKLLARGGVVGGTSAGAAIFSGTMIAGGNPTPTIRPGWDLLPKVVIDQHFTQRNRKPRLESALEKHPALVGLGLDEGTAALIQGRDVRIVGKGVADLIWLESGVKQHLVLKPGEKDDLVRWSRLPQTPTRRESRGQPVLDSGHIMAVGGGGLGKDLVRKFIELAGGPDAPIVVLPTANGGDSFLEAKQTESIFLREGAKRVKALTGTTLAEVESESFLKSLNEAKGIWFGGGRQWRFVDAYENTIAVEAMRAVLKRGGIIGGSSAGATILGDYLCRGGPLGNLEIMVKGYETGFAFLPGVGIDQHFKQRNRFKDMESFVATHPAFVGIGIDERTAFLVGPSGAEVLGPGQVHVYPAGGGEKTSYSQGDSLGKSWWKPKKDR